MKKIVEIYQTPYAKIYLLIVAIIFGCLTYFTNFWFTVSLSLISLGVYLLFYTSLVLNYVLTEKKKSELVHVSTYKYKAKSLGGVILIGGILMTSNQILLFIF